MTPTRTAAYRLADEHGLTLEERGGSMPAPRRAAAPTAPRCESDHSGTRMRVVFFSDMEGFTAFIDRLGDLQARKVIRLHDGIVRAAVRAFGGSEIQHTGDGVMVAFENAQSAVGCAARIHRDFAQHSQHHPRIPIRVRIGMDAGTPLEQEDRLFGAVVNAAARLCNRAPAGATLVSASVCSLLPSDEWSFRYFGTEKLKGFSKPFQVFELKDATA